MPEGAPPPLTPAREALVALAAALATRDEERLREAIRRAVRDSDPVAAEEVLLQSHLFVGFPLALEAVVLWREVSGLPAPAGLGEAPALWQERGPRVCARVYGGNYDKLRRNVTRLHPDLDRWMVEGGYGRVIGRPGLDLATRELCIAALLAVWDAPRQLHSHLRGALNAGASAADVTRALEIAAEQLDPARAGRVLELWNEIAIRYPSSAIRRFGAGTGNG